MKKTYAAWSVPVAVEDIPDTGLHMKIDAPDATRAALAGLASLRDLPKLSASFDLTRHGSAVHVTGRVRALVGQICVVTLEPIENTVDEAIDLKFAPRPQSAGDREPKDAARRKRGGDDNLPEPLVGGILDLGALATEFLILGIDPYPRKAGAQFAALELDDTGEKPFAALAALKKRLGSN